MDLLYIKASEIIEFDKNIERTDLIKILIKKTDIISRLFKYLTEDEKKQYFIYTYSFIIEDYIENFNINDKIEILNSKYEMLDEYILHSLCLKIEDVHEKEMFLEFFKDKISQYYIYQIIRKLSCDDDKQLFINKYMYEDYYIIKCIKLLSDDYKEKYIDKIRYVKDQINIILSLNDTNRIKKYVSVSKYKIYYSTLIAATNDSNYIIFEFNKSHSKGFKMELINKTQDLNLKLQLIEMLEDKEIKEFLLSNFVKEKQLLTKLDGTKVDDNITIGVELECSNKKIENYINTESIFREYKITADSSVKKGFEIVSPILKYNVKDLNTLKNVCNLLNKCNFYTDYTSGGHIHIGSSYLTKKEDYYMLLYLYINTEDILYFICDRKNSIKRKYIDDYACKNKNDYIKAIDEGVFDTSSDIKRILEHINNNRYKGLNFKNLNCEKKETIEFRMPNGEINFDELLLNIKLFSRLIEMSHKLNEMDDSNVIKVKAMKLSNIEDEKERLQILLDILFDNEEEKQKYKSRYYSNKKLYLINLKNLISELKSKTYYSEKVEIDNKHLVINKNEKSKYNN